MTTPTFVSLLLAFGVGTTAGCDRRQAPRPSADKGVHDDRAAVSTKSAPKKADLVVTRVFAAPVERVWKAWTDSELVMQWWGPTGFTCPVARMEFREGGVSLVCMRAPREAGGQDMYNTWTYEKIDSMNRFVYVNRFSDKDGNAMDPVKQGLSPDIPKEMRHEVSFRKLGRDKAEITVIEYGWPVGPMMEMSKTGLEQCLDKMAVVLGK